MKDNLFIENLKQSTGMRIFLFLIILLISSLIGTAITTIFIFSGDNGLRIAQGLSSIFMFVVPPIVYYYITRKTNQLQALGFRKMKQPWLFLLIGVVLMFSAMPVTGQLNKWNAAMDLGPAFSKLEEYLKMLEESTQAALEKMENCLETYGDVKKIWVDIVTTYHEPEKSDNILLQRKKRMR